MLATSRRLKGTFADTSELRKFLLVRRAQPDTTSGQTLPGAYWVGNPKPGCTIVAYDDFTVNTTKSSPRYKEIRDALSSFPSGRARSAWLAAWFLCLYLSIKLRSIHRDGPSERVGLLIFRSTLFSGTKDGYRCFTLSIAVCIDGLSQYALLPPCDHS